MGRAKFSIGIDLGTTNCAMAFEALDEASSRTEVFPISQLETITAFVEASTLPSFLYLPPKEEIAGLPGAAEQSDRWIPGRLARKKAAESPGRVQSGTQGLGEAFIRLTIRRSLSPCRRVLTLQPRR